MSNARLLIVHPDSSSLALLRSMLYTSGGRVDEAATDREAVRLLERNGADLILAGVDPADPDALELLQYVRRKHPSVPIVLLFTAPSSERSREATQRGAAAVLRFPLPATELRAAVSQAMQRPLESAPVPRQVLPTFRACLQGESRPAGLPVGELHTEGELLGRDPAVQMAIELAGAIAPTRTPVLISGERGTGKTLLARSIHARSPRRDGPFVEVACSTLKPAHLERELFGQKSGGPADKPFDRPGKLSLADGGTLFLNEVGALTPDLQFKLLRVLQDMEFESVDSTQTVHVDVRIVVGSSDDLAQLVAQGRFRQDLYERLCAVCLKLPPLRQRGGDVEMLAQRFRVRFARDNARDVSGFTPEALALLREHAWPGNVRELENAVERGVVVCRGGKITPANLALSTAEPKTGVRAVAHTPRPHVGVGIRPLKEALEEPEKQLILQALEALNWNRQETARVLDINRTTLYKKMKKYGLLMHEPAWAN